MAEKSEKRPKLSLRKSRGLLEGEDYGKPAASEEKVQLKDLGTKEDEPSNGGIRFRAITEIAKEEASKKEAEKGEAGKEEVVPPKEVTKELKEEWQESQAFYREAVTLAQEVFEKVKEGHSFDTGRVRKVVERLVDELTLGNQNLVLLATGTDEGYSQLASNAVNVTIISIMIGLALNYNKSSLMELGMASFFRDVGLVILTHVIEQPRRLKPKEYEEVKKHPLYTERFLEGLGIGDEISRKVVLQHHEREDGSGYPSKLRGNGIHEYAKIIGIAEVYESMTHNRPVRAGMPPHTAMREILEEGRSLFGHRVAKAFVAEFGVYPVGSTVELNTGEIARVVAVHKEFPFRPVVQIVLDSGGRPMAKVLNLLEKPQVFIKRPVEEVRRKQ
jgi:HD-GYP domain-containing protein (c-di-GMP phosphodiesterase class II)